MIRNGGRSSAIAKAYWTGVAASLEMPPVVLEGNASYEASVLQVRRYLRSLRRRLLGAGSSETVILRRQLEVGFGSDTVHGRQGGG